MPSTTDTITIGELQVHRLAYGAMRITGPGVWGEPADPAGARALLEHVVREGVDLIDTADSYGPDVSENLIAEALSPYPEGLVIATKGGLTRPGPGVWERDCHPKRLKRCCEDSLRRLKLERIELYQLHAVDPRVPVEDSIGALEELRAEGKIRHIGVCNVTVEQLARARAIAPIVSVQNRYNIADRGAEDVLGVCERDGLGFLPWFPLATGALAKPGGVLDDVAGAHGATPAQVALAWLLEYSSVTVPIPGTSSIEHFDENLAAAQLELSEQELEELDGLAAPEEAN
jgi:pyridoxine 4-dehydrogenase